MTEPEITPMTPKEQFVQVLTDAMLTFFKQTGMQIKVIDLTWHEFYKGNTIRKEIAKLVDITIKAE